MKTKHLELEVSVVTRSLHCASTETHDVLLRWSESSWPKLDTKKALRTDAFITVEAWLYIVGKSVPGNMLHNCVAASFCYSKAANAYQDKDRGAFKE